MTASRMPTRLLLGITALLAVLLVVSGAVAILDTIAQDEQRSTRPLGDVSAIEVDADNGDVEIIRVAAGARPSLETIERSGLFGGPSVRVQASGGRIRARSDCDDLIFAARCSVRMVLRLPSGASARVRTGSGDIAVRGVRGAVDLQSGSGDIEVDGAAGARMLLSTGSGDIDVDGADVRLVDADTGSGDVTVRGASAPRFVLDASSGDVELDATSVPRSVDVESGSGDLSIVVPGGAYDVDVDTGSGDEDIRVTQDPDAENVMRLHTGSGDVEVRRR